MYVFAQQVIPVSAAPDTFYLHNTATTGITPAGEYMNNTEGSVGSTKTFDTVNQDEYWYIDETWPTGNDDATIAAGTYTLNLYFNQLPAAWYDPNWLYRKKITIDNTQVIGASDHSNFPV